MNAKSLIQTAIHAGWIDDQGRLWVPSYSLKLSPFYGVDR